MPACKKSALLGSVWPRLFPFGLFGPVCLCLVLVGPGWPWLALFGPVWPSLALVGPACLTWPSLALFDYFFNFHFKVHTLGKQFTKVKLCRACYSSAPACFSYSQAPNQKTSFTKYLSFVQWCSKLIFKAVNGIIQRENNLFLLLPGL